MTVVLMKAGIDPILIVYITACTVIGHLFELFSKLRLIRQGFPDYRNITAEIEEFMGSPTETRMWRICTCICGRYHCNTANSRI